MTDGRILEQTEAVFRRLPSLRMSKADWLSSPSLEGTGLVLSTVSD